MNGPMIDLPGTDGLTTPRPLQQQAHYRPLGGRRGSAIVAPLHHLKLSGRIFCKWGRIRIPTVVWWYPGASGPVVPSMGVLRWEQEGNGSSAILVVVGATSVVIASAMVEHRVILELLVKR